VLWQHVFQVVVCVLSAVQRAAQHCITYNDVFLLIISTKV